MTRSLGRKGSGYDLIYEAQSRDPKEYPEIESDYNKMMVTLRSKIIDPETENGVLVAEGAKKTRTYRLAKKNKSKINPEKKLGGIMKRFGWVFFLFLLCGSVGADTFFRNGVMTGKEGPWTDSRAFSSIAAAVSHIGGDTRTLLIAKQEACAALTIPANVNLEFSKGGSIANTGQLTINSKYIIAGNYQIFTGSGDIDFAGGQTVKTAWFASATDAIDYTADDAVTLEVSESDTISVDASLGTNVTLSFPAYGNTLTIGAGATLSNIDSVVAGRYQIFSGSGDLDFVNGAEVRSTWMGGLEGSVGYLESEEVNLLLDRSETLSGNLTISDNIYISIIPGNSINLASNNLVINNTPDNFDAATDEQVFTGFGDVSFSYAGAVWAAWYGAVGDDATDNTDEIERAWNSLDGGGTVLLGPGTFRCANVDPANNNITLQGKGKYLTILKLNTAGLEVLDLEGLIDITVRDIEIDGGNGASLAECGIILNDSDNITIDNCYIHDFASHAILGRFEGNHWNITNNHIYSNGAAGNYGIDFSGGYFVNISGNYVNEGTIYGESSHGIGIQNVVIDSNIVDIGRIAFSVSTGTVKEFVISNNVVDNGNVSSSCILWTGDGVSDGGSVVISGNHLYNGYLYGISCGGYSTAVNITGNHIYTTGRHGIRVSDIQDSVVISGNSIVDAGFAGMYVNNCDASITGNIIKNSGQQGSDEYGIYLDHEGRHTITGNTIVDDQVSPTMEYGIYENLSGDDYSASIGINHIFGMINGPYYIKNHYFFKHLKTIDVMRFLEDNSSAHDLSDTVVENSRWDVGVVGTGSVDVADGRLQLTCAAASTDVIDIKGYSRVRSFENPIVKFRFQTSSAFDPPNVQMRIGVYADATHYCLFRLNSNADILVESDNGGVDQDSDDTGIDIASDTFYTFEIVLDTNSPKFFIDGVNVTPSTFAGKTSGNLCLYAYLENENGGTQTIYIRHVTTYLGPLEG